MMAKKPETKKPETKKKRIKRPPRNVADWISAVTGTPKQRSMVIAKIATDDEAKAICEGDNPKQAVNDLCARYLDVNKATQGKEEKP